MDSFSNTRQPSASTLTLPAPPTPPPWLAHVQRQLAARADEDNARRRFITDYSTLYSRYLYLLQGAAVKRPEDDADSDSRNSMQSLQRSTIARTPLESENSEPYKEELAAATAALKAKIVSLEQALYRSKEQVRRLQSVVANFEKENRLLATEYYALQENNHSLITKYNDVTGALSSKDRTIIILQDELMAIKLELTSKERLIVEKDAAITALKADVAANVLLNQGLHDSLQRAPSPSLMISSATDTNSKSKTIDDPNASLSSTAENLSHRAEKLFAAHETTASCLAISREGSTLASGGADSLIKMWRPRKGFSSPWSQIQSAFGNISTLSFGSRGTLAAGGSDNAVYLFAGVRERTPRLAGSFVGHTSTVTAVDIAQESDNLIVSASSDCTIRLWNPDRQHCLRTIFGLSPCTGAVIVDPSATSVCSSHADGFVRHWDTSSGSIKHAISARADTEISGISLFDQNTILACSRDGSLTVLDFRTPAKELDYESTPRLIPGQISISPFGHYVAACAKNSSLAFWDLRTSSCKVIENSLAVRKPSFEANTVSVQWDPRNSTRIYSIDEIGTMTIWIA